MRPSPRQLRLSSTSSPWLTLPEVAAVLGRSEAIARQAVRTGALEGHYAGVRALRVHRSDVERLADEIRSGTRRSATDAPAALRVADYERRMRTAESREAARTELAHHRERLAAIRAVQRGAATQAQLDLVIHGSTK